MSTFTQAFYFLSFLTMEDTKVLQKRHLRLTCSIMCVYMYYVLLTYRRRRFLDTCAYRENSKQGLFQDFDVFQDFASEGANVKFQNSRGGGANTKPRRGNPILKGQKSQFLGGGGANGSQGGAKAPPGPPP